MKYLKEKQEKINKVKLNIIENADWDIIYYYGINQYVYENIDEYLDDLDNDYDKINVAQWANNFTTVKKLIKNLKLDPYKKLKYLKLLDKNIELDETINFEILDPKYDFLDDVLDSITTDIIVQEQITSLPEEYLELFKLLYNNLKKITDYPIPYISKILETMGYVTPNDSHLNNYHKYDKLSHNIGKLLLKGYTLTDNDIETLLFLYTSSVKWKVDNIWELREFGKPNTKDQLDMDNIIEKQRNAPNKNIKFIKTALLWKTYCINLSEAENICKRYDLLSLEINEDNKDLFEMYKAILNIINENDPDILIEIYDKFVKEHNTRLDFMRITTFETDLRKEFAKDLNKVVFKTEDKESTNVDGVKIIDANTDFKMIVTSIGAYQKSYTEQENYSDYWNSKKIRSHGNCCSLIANNNLSMVEPKNIILGFSKMSDNMLLLSGYKDINSTPDSRNFNAIKKQEKYFVGHTKLINNTRSSFNELVYERRDLNTNPLFYKKNPDYIVFIEEYLDINKYIDKYKDNKELYEYILEQKQRQDRLWKESLKAAKDFNVPIVKINREKCAINSITYINNLINQLKTTKNPKLIEEIITQFENNRVGNNKNHKLVREEYFSKHSMNEILCNIENLINQESNIKLKKELLESYINIINLENKKVEENKNFRRLGQTSGINFDEVLKRIEEMKIDLEEQKRRNI